MREEILEIKKSTSHNFFATKKRRSVLKSLRLFLQELGFDMHEANQILSPLGDTDDNYSANKYSSRLYYDRCFSFINEAYRIDMFFGKDKVAVSIFTTTDKQEEFSKALFHYFSL